MNKGVGISASINDKHLFKDYGLVISNTDVVGYPEVKTRYVEIPGGSSYLDLSEALSGDVEYGKRVLHFQLVGKAKIASWRDKISELARDVHGKSVEVVFDDDPNFVYHGRAEIKQFDRKREIGAIELEIECQPFKLERLSSIEPWVWDSFNFETGVIREYADIQINKIMQQLTITGSDMPMVPIFHVKRKPQSKKTPIVYVPNLQQSFELHEGKNRFAQIVVKRSGLTLFFQGDFSVSVEVRGGAI